MRRQIQEEIPEQQDNRYWRHERQSQNWRLEQQILETGGAMNDKDDTGGATNDKDDTGDWSHERQRRYWRLEPLE